MLLTVGTYLDLPEDIMVQFRLMVTVSTARQLQCRIITCGSDLDMFLNLEADDYVDMLWFRTLLGNIMLLDNLYTYVSLGNLAEQIPNQRVSRSTLRQMRQHWVIDLNNAIEMIDGRCQDLAYLKYFQVRGERAGQLCDPHRNQRFYPINYNYLPFPMLFVLFPQLR